MTAIKQLVKSFIPPGPVATAYLNSQLKVNGIMGPVGSGKTTATIMKIMMLAARQKPSEDGISYTRFIAIRNTYPELNKTTIQSWKQWFGHYPGFTGGEKSTGKHTIITDVPIINEAGLPEIRKVHLEMWFVAIADRSVEDVCRGLEPTGVWLNEADLCNPEIFDYMMGRVGRYLPPGHPGNTWSGILMDYNAPDEDNYVYKLMEEDRHTMVANDDSPLVGFFRQPGGMDPGAENKAFLDEKLPGYYENQIQILSKRNGGKALIRRMIHNKYGYSRQGKPVFEAFDDERNVSPVTLELQRDPIFVIGLDQGLNPAAVFTQRSYERQLRIMRALSPRNIRSWQFGKMLKEEIELVCPDHEIIGICDPAGDSESSQSDDTWMDEVAEVAGIKIEEAFTSNIETRLNAVDHFLLMNLPNGEPGLIMDHKSKVLTKSLMYGYILKRIKDPSAERYHDTPHKNEWSDVADALENACLFHIGEKALRGREDEGFIRRKKRYDKMNNDYNNQGDWHRDPLGR